MPQFTNTKEQDAVIDYEGSLVAIAKPGSGKTSVLSQLIQKQLPTLPDFKGVIAISYTNKASDELKKRSTRGGINTKCSFFGTIDRFCDSEVIIPFLPHIWGLPDDEITVSKISDLPEAEQEQFSSITENTVSLEMLDENIDAIRSYYKKGMLFLEANGALAQFVMRNSKACRRFIQTRYSHIIIDEYQDSGLEQNELFLMLHKLGLVAVAVGDPDQSIFGFSNKDSKYLLSLPQNDEFRTFPITRNHRSHASIINYSLRLLDENAELLPSDEIRVFHKRCNGGSSSISSWIQSVIADLVKEYDVGCPSKIGILGRSSRTCEEINASLSLKHRYFQSHPLETHLSLWSKIFTSLLFYRFGQPISAQDIIDDSRSRVSGSQLREARKLIKSVRNIEDDRLKEHLEEVACLLLPKAKSEEALAVLQDTNIADLSDFFSPAADDEIQLMTIHKSKGLEFDIVFHLDLHEWVLPAKRPSDDGNFDNAKYTSLEQDRNLHYVAVTRARKACIFCTSSSRTNSRGSSSRTSLSEFLALDFLKTLRTQL